MNISSIFKPVFIFFGLLFIQDKYNPNKNGLSTIVFFKGIDLFRLIKNS